MREFTIARDFGATPRQPKPGRFTPG